MITTFYRILKYGIQSFARNYLISIATVLVLILAVVVFQSLILFGVIGGEAISIIQDKIDISIEFRAETSEDDMLGLKTALEKLDEVREVEYISQDEALEKFKARHPADSDIAQALAEIEENPLRASLNIKAHNPRDYSTIAAYLNNESLAPIIETVSYNQNYLVINRLARIIDIGRQTGLLLTLILSIIASIVAFNTILLAIHSNKDEIAIMRIVGASNTFIRGPYIVVGIIYGLCAAVVGTLFMSPAIYFASPIIAVLVPDMNIWTYFLNNIFLILGYNLLFAIIIGVVSSFIVVKKYLRG